MLDRLSEVVRQVLSQPLFILGTALIIVMYFAPSGLTGLGGRLVRKRRPT